jgi:hypothetical protein
MQDHVRYFQGISVVCCFPKAIGIRFEALSASGNCKHPGQYASVVVSRLAAALPPSKRTGPSPQPDPRVIKILELTETTGDGNHPLAAAFGRRYAPILDLVTLCYVRLGSLS